MEWSWWKVVFAGIAAMGLLGVAAPLAQAEPGYSYEPGYPSDLEYRPRIRKIVPAPPPPPDFGPACPVFPHDLRISGANWHLFSPTYKAFPRWSGYNDTYPRGFGSEFSFSGRTIGF